MNNTEIREILALPQQHRATVTRLMGLYNFIKDTWTPLAITELREKHNINLRTTLGKCRLARLASEIELQLTSKAKEVDSSESVTVPQDNSSEELPVSNENLANSPDSKLNTQVQTTKILVRVIGLLLPGKELNGRQLTPAFRVFGMAATKDMLRHNYKLLRKIEHPDISKHEPEIANARYAFVTKLYKVLSSNWKEKYDPTLPITRELLEKAMSVKLPFEPASFKKN